MLFRAVNLVLSETEKLEIKLQSNSLFIYFPVTTLKSLINILLDDLVSVLFGLLNLDGNLYADDVLALAVL